MLLNDSYAPMTSEIGFLRCTAQAAAEAYVKWQTPIQAARGVGLQVKARSGPLSDHLQSQLPLTSVERRRSLFLPTAGPWTAYFDNGWRGPDAFSVVSHLARTIGCRGARAAFVEHAQRQETGRLPGRPGAVIFETYAATDTDFLNTERSVALVFEGGKWDFSKAGKLLPFEDAAAYEQRQVRLRFDLAMLQRYLHAIDIEAFDDSFYPADKPGYLVSKNGPSSPAMKEHSLASVRAQAGLAN